MSLYRKLVWFVKGYREYTISGYERAAINFNPSDLDVDCSSKSYMITGANSGLGYECAKQIAQRNGVVHMVCRNKETGQKALEEIKKSTGNNHVYLHIVDVSRPKQIIEFTSKFSEPLNVLVNNAGCLINEKITTEEGLDKNFATNTLGGYLFTAGLLEKLKKEADPRVIFVSSGGMLLEKLDYEDFNFEKMAKYDGIVAYSQNKRQQVIMAEELAKGYKEVFIASMHPGWSTTPGVQNALPDFYTKMQSKLRTTLQGADTIIWLAISPSVKMDTTGSFFQDRVPVSKHLPMAWTNSSAEEQSEFMKRLETLAQTFYKTP